MELKNYLFFSGRCEEALAFYEIHLGARVQFLMRFNESPVPIPAGVLQPGFENKVMHAQLSLGDTQVYASDGCDDKTSFSGFSLALTLNSQAEAERLFAVLAEDGKVIMPLAPIFWSPLYGQVTDKFGIAWMLMLPGENS